MRKSRGFTLVELAIVMTVIGILIGGILKGEELIMNARITATIRDYQGILAAMNTFRDKYGQIPGDMSTAQARLPGCGGLTPAGNWCTGGNGNARIGDLPTNGGNNVAHKDQSSTLNMPELETSLFWKHLALSELIVAVSPSADPVNDVATGITHPTTPLGGAFTILYSQNHQNKRWVKGHVLRLQAGAHGSQMPLGEDVLEGRYAWIFDRKIDDGLPKSGFVVGTHDGLGGGNPNDYMEPPHDSSHDWMLYLGLEGNNQRKQ